MKIGIKKKLFLIIFLIFSLNIITVLLFGGTFLEQFYIHNKKQELIQSSISIQQAYSQDGITGLQEPLQECAAQNTTVLVYDQIQRNFIFLGNQNTNVDPRIESELWLRQAEQDQIFNKLQGRKYVFMEADGQLTDSIYFYTKLNEHTYLFMETPKAYIETTANTALQFFAYVSIGALVLGILATYFMASKIVRPIKQIDSTAQKISNMDFSEKCDVHTGDEIEALANSVNKMSDALKQNIDILKRDLEREEQTNKMRREFVANVSHDFKTPLSLISAYSEALRDNTEPEKSGEICDILVEQSNTMSQLVNQLLTLTQLESGMMTYEMSFFSINELVSTVIHNCKILLEKKGITVQSNLEEEMMVQGDFNRIVQVFTNIFENAIKYVDEKKKISVWLTRQNGMVRVNLFNSHPPIPQQDLNEVFDLFYRADKSRTASAKSYGIGLAIVKTIIQAHEGNCGAYHKDDGVVFWFELKEFVFEDDEEEFE
ncbi:MAG: HAMP domain-containing histidine kinase [Massilioclostridium sp.]|nr:MAG: HAMP domain-containing histidine kinase [Massilioclostridium sp.]